MRMGLIRNLAIFAVAAMASLPAFAADPRVLVIGIDGAGGRYLPAADTPHIDALIENGTARYDFYNEGGLVENPPPGYGASGVNWSTIVTGASAAHHGVIDNSFAGSKFNNHPHFFKYIKDHNSDLYRASMVSWEPINSQILADQFASLERQFPGLTSAQQDALVRDTTMPSSSILTRSMPPATVQAGGDRNTMLRCRPSMATSATSCRRSTRGRASLAALRTGW
jgi:hypothetical protein